MNFPQDKKLFFLPGPAGQLEVQTTWPREDKKGVVIICHPHPLHEGTMNNKVVTTLAQTFDQLGLKTVRFNFRGVGKSEGKYGETIGETEDLLALLKWVKQTLPNHFIWLAGFSFGGYIAAKVAAQEKISQLITIAPGITLHDFSTLKDVNCPWLIIQGDADEIIPYDQVKAFVNQHPTPITFKVLTGAGHFFHGRLGDLKQVLLESLSF